MLVVGGGAFALVRLAPCAFADSRAPTDGILASAERWLEVAPPFPSAPDPDGTVVLDLSVREVRAGGVAGPIMSEGVAIHEVFLREIRPALDEGSRVFLALTSQGLTREMVSYVVARGTDGTHVFLFGCDIDLTTEARGLLGARYDTAIRRIIGLTDPDSIYGVLAGVRKAPEHVLVEYEERPDVRQFTRTGRLIERGACLALITDVGPLVPIVDAAYYYLARDDDGLVLMSEMQKLVRPGDTVELAGREMSPDEALAVTDRESVRSCPGRLILIGSISRIVTP